MRNDPARTNPVAAARPRATRLCVRLRRAMEFCSSSMMLTFKTAIVLFVVCIFVDLVSRGRLPGEPAGVVFGLVMAVITLSFIVYVAAFLLRLLVIALCFMRYSLSQMMGVILFGSSCVTLIMKLPGEWKALPAGALAFLALLVVGYIIAHDPEDPWFSADFVRKTFGPKNAAPAGDVQDPASVDAPPSTDGQERDRG